MNPVISLLNNHDVEIRQKTQPGSIPRSDIANLLDAIALRIEKDVPYQLGIPFDSMVSSMTGKQLTANDKYFVSQVGSIPGGGCMLALAGDGVHAPDLSNFFLVSGAYNISAGVVNQLIFYYDGSSNNYCVSIVQLPAGATITAVDNGPDTTPPVVASIAVMNANPSQVVITYNEALKTTAIPAAGDFVVTAGGSPATINSVAVSSNTVLLNLASPIIAGSSNFIQYTPGTNKTQDLAGNLAAAIPVNTLITNNVGTGGGTATQLATPTLTATANGQSEIDVVLGAVANASSYVLEESPDNATWTQIGTTAGTYTRTGITASTIRYYRGHAVGNGTTYSNSANATANATTAASGPANVTSWPTLNSMTASTNNLTATADSGNAVSGVKLPAGQDGYLQYTVQQVTAPDSNVGTGVLGLKSTNTPSTGATGYLAIDFAVYSFGGTLYTVSGGSAVNSSISSPNGTLARVRRYNTSTSPMMAFEYSTDGGTTWTNIKAAVSCTSGDLFPEAWSYRSTFTINTIIGLGLI